MESRLPESPFQPPHRHVGNKGLFHSAMMLPTSDVGCKNRKKNLAAFRQESAQHRWNLLQQSSAAAAHQDAVHAV